MITYVSNVVGIDVSIKWEYLKVGDIVVVLKEDCDTSSNIASFSQLKVRLEPKTNFQAVFVHWKHLQQALCKRDGKFSISVANCLNDEGAPAVMIRNSDIKGCIFVTGDIAKDTEVLNVIPFIWDFKVSEKSKKKNVFNEVYEHTLMKMYLEHGMKYGFARFDLWSMKRCLSAKSLSGRKKLALSKHYSEMCFWRAWGKWNSFRKDLSCFACMTGTTFHPDAPFSTSLSSLLQKELVRYKAHMEKCSKNEKKLKLLNRVEKNFFERMGSYDIYPINLEAQTMIFGKDVIVCSDSEDVRTEAQIISSIPCIEAVLETDVDDDFTVKKMSIGDAGTGYESKHTFCSATLGGTLDGMCQPKVYSPAKTSRDITPPPVETRTLGYRRIDKTTKLGEEKIGLLGGSNLYTKAFEHLDCDNGALVNVHHLTETLSDRKEDSLRVSKFRDDLELPTSPSKRIRASLKDDVESRREMELKLTLQELETELNVDIDRDGEDVTRVDDPQQFCDDVLNQLLREGKFDGDLDGEFAGNVEETRFAAGISCDLLDNLDSGELLAPKSGADDEISISDLPDDSTMEAELSKITAKSTEESIVGYGSDALEEMLFGRIDHPIGQVFEDDFRPGVFTEDETECVEPIPIS